MNQIIKKYENHKINIFDAIIQLDKISIKDNNSGIIYTPKYIADYIVKQLNVDIEETILEPSVGHGVFIFSLIEYIENKYKLTSQALYSWFNSKVYMSDINQQSINELNILLTTYFKKKGIIDPFIDNLFCADTLFDIKNQVDCIIGNPPYIRTKYIDTDYLNKLKNHYSSCEKGNINLYYAFIEYAIKHSKKSSFIVPNSYIANKSAFTLRQIMLPNLDTIIDFKNHKIFPDADTYTSIFFIKENSSNEVIIKNRLNDDGLIVNKKDLIRNFVYHQFKELKLSENVRIKGGIETLFNKGFVIEHLNDISNKQDFIAKTSFDNKTYLIESSICKKLYKVTKPDKSFFVIYPYDEEGKIIEESILESNFPNTYEYLLSIKRNLQARDKGKTDKYESWYAYGRKQGLHSNKEPFHVFIPKMISNNLKIRIIEDNDFLFLSGYIISVSNIEDADILKSLLESRDFFDYIKQSGTSWSGQGEKEYYSLRVELIKRYLGLI